MAIIFLALFNAYGFVDSAIPNTKSAVAVGLVTSGGGFGSFTFPFIIAYISDRTSLHNGFLFCLSADIVMAVVTCAVILLLRFRARHAGLAVGRGEA